jgi:hypothetical protein
VGLALLMGCCPGPPTPATATAPSQDPANTSAPAEPGVAPEPPSRGASAAIQPAPDLALASAPPVDSAAGSEPTAEPPAEPGPEAQPVDDRAPPTLHIAAEQPFKLYQRPRPTGAVHAAVSDENLARWNVGGTGDPEFISNRPGYHPGARVVVDASVLRGNLPARAPRDRRTGRPKKVLSEHTVLARSRKYGYWPFRLCFEAGLRRKQTLSGQTVVRLTTNAAGKVTATRLVGTKLEDEAVAECLAERTRELTYEPAPGRRIDVELSIKLWPGHAPVPLAGPPMEDPPENPGRLDRKAMALALEPLHGTLRDCYRQGLERDPGLWGRVQLLIEQNAKGEVTRVTEDESRFPDRQVSRCLARVVKEARLPPPAGGELVFCYALRLGQMPSAD